MWGVACFAALDTIIIALKSLSGRLAGSMLDTLPRLMDATCERSKQNCSERTRISAYYFGDGNSIIFHWHRRAMNIFALDALLMAHFVVQITAASAPNSQHRIVKSCLFPFLAPDTRAYTQIFLSTLHPAPVSMHIAQLCRINGCHHCKQSKYDKSFRRHL